MGRDGVLLVVVIGVFLAGCTGSGLPGAESPDSSTLDTATPTPTPENPDPTPNGALNRTPTDTTECDPVESRSLPDRPSNLTQETAVQFTEQYAKASARNESVWDETFPEPHLNNELVTVHGFLINQTQTGYVIHVNVHRTVRECERPSGMGSVVGYDYFLNNSMIAVNTSFTNGYFDSPAEHHSVSKREILQDGTIQSRWNTSQG